MAIRFKTNPQKALEVILWFANARQGIDFHSVLKLLFFADKEHLNAYGRPIVGDRYMALSYGPVAQTTYDILKREPLALEALGVEDAAELPFEVRGYRVFAKRAPDMRKLSESDLEALGHAFAEYGDLDFSTKTELSHGHRAYRNAEAVGRQRMDYGDFLEGEMASPEIVADLEETAHRLCI